MKCYVKKSQVSTFALFSVIGSTIIAIACIFWPISIQIAVLGSLLSILSGLVFTVLQQAIRIERELNCISQAIGQCFSIAQDSPLLRQYKKIIDGICKSLSIDGQLFRGLLLERLEETGEQASSLSKGIIEFQQTETWRTAYEKVLRSNEVNKYLSISVIRSENYWQHAPGRQSIELNYELQDSKGLAIERIAILSESVWPKGNVFPKKRIFDWLLEQHNHGIWIELVRLDQLKDEKQLVVDSGIYGEIATGIQHLDERSETCRFQLSFAPSDVEYAEDRWERLKLFSVSLRKLLDKSGD